MEVVKSCFVGYGTLGLLRGGIKGFLSLEICGFCPIFILVFPHFPFLYCILIILPHGYTDFMHEKLILLESEGMIVIIKN